ALAAATDPRALTRLYGADDPGVFVVQSIASGDEITVDFYVDRQGSCLATVPRRRVETRAGEVSKGVTVSEPAVEALVAAMCARLPGPYGALNVQLLRDPATGESAVIEINPRFGGGYPLSLAAGADFPAVLVAEAAG